MNIIVLFTRDQSGLPSEDNGDVARDVVGALTRLGHQVSQVAMRRPPPDLDCDVVFNLCEGLDGNPGLEPHVAAWLELLDVPFTGNRAETLWRALDKADVPGPAAPRVVVSRADFSRADFSRSDLSSSDLSRSGLTSADLSRAASIPFPAIVKPRRADASLGIEARSVVHDPAALRLQVERVVERFGEAVVEQYLEGREFNAAILDDSVLAVAEMDFSGLPAGMPHIVTYAGKWDPQSPEYRGTVPHYPPDIPSIVPEVALQAARISGCRSYARVDLRMNAAGQVFVLEVNPNPDLGAGAGMARAALAAGLSYEALIARILEQAVRPGSVDRMKDSSDSTAYARRVQAWTKTAASPEDGVSPGRNAGT